MRDRWSQPHPERHRATMIVGLGVLLLSGSGVAPAVAQMPTEEPPRSVLIPIPILFYTPETEVGFGAALSYIRRAAGSTWLDRPSSFSSMWIFTTRSQVIASLGADHYWDGERQQVNGGISYQKFPNTFFGIGNDTAAEGEEYTDEGPSVGVDYMLRLFPAFRVGAGFEFGSSSITGTASGDALHGDTVPGAGGGQAIGAGLRLNLDTRNNINYPGRGGYFDLSWRVYDDIGGADFAFNRVSLDLRHYIALGRRNLIALRARGVSAGGHVPFQLMPALGGQNLMRGYFGGRFRDAKAVSAQGELRMGIWRRLGGTVFGSLGQVAPDFGAMNLDRLHAAYGFGLRVLLVRQEGMNLRVDWGFGEDESGFYLSLGEAF